MLKTQDKMPEFHCINYYYYFFSQEGPFHNSTIINRLFKIKIKLDGKLLYVEVTLCKIEDCFLFKISKKNTLPFLKNCF